MIRVLILGAGGAASNSVARCLRMAGGYVIHGANCDPYDLAFADADHRHLLPRADDPDYLDALDDLVADTRPRVILPQPEEEVMAVAEGGWSAMMPSADALETCADKFASYVLWAEAGITVPETRRIATLKDLMWAMHDLGPEVWLRPSSGAGGYGALKTSVLDEAWHWIGRHDGWGRFTAAQVLEPETVAWQSLWYDGHLIAAQAKRRLRWANARNVPSGVGGSAAISETISDPQVTAIAQRAIKAVAHRPHGLFGVDMALDSAGVPNPTEINAGRFFTTVDFFAMAGLNLPDLFCALTHDQERRASLLDDEPQVNPLPDGLVHIRGMDQAPIVLHRDDLAEMGHPLEAVAA